MNHARTSRKFLKDAERVHWHDRALWFVREKRDLAVDQVPEWESLRDRAVEIKDHTLANLEHYLNEFKKNATANGIIVHRAADAGEHNRIVHEILAARGVTKLVKSKSMLTEECGLNEFLEQKGIEVIDTDLGERIIQLRNEPPSHIVLPAIHLKREDVGDLFRERLGTDEGNNDPGYLTARAREHLRNHFLTAEAGLTGVNFAVADRGGIVLCTNEGNGDLGATLPPLHIACMGIEKLVPGMKELAVFIRMLARSATGQPVTAYTSHYFGPRPGGEMHVVIVDNGRSKILAHPKYRQSLRCIRCGACLNTCPVYRRSGGHSYGYPIPGPIGSVLSPHYNLERHKSLPYASTLCGSCSSVCPVRISLHELLLEWRRDVVRAGRLPLIKRMMMFTAGRVLISRPIYHIVSFAGRRLLPLVPGFMLKGKWNPWTRGREMPVFPKKRFRDLIKDRNYEKQ